MTRNIYCMHLVNQVSLRFGPLFTNGQLHFSRMVHMLVSAPAIDFFSLSVVFRVLVEVATNSTTVSSGVNLWRYALVSRDTFDLSKDTDWMCERGGPLSHRASAGLIEGRRGYF